jgi:hypothetical protein
MKSLAEALLQMGNDLAELNIAEFQAFADFFHLNFKDDVQTKGYVE